MKVGQVLEHHAGRRSGAAEGELQPRSGRCRLQDDFVGLALRVVLVELGWQQEGPDRLGRATARLVVTPRDRDIQDLVGLCLIFASSPPAPQRRAAAVSAAGSSSRFTSRTDPLRSRLVLFRQGSPTSVNAAAGGAAPAPGTQNKSPLVRNPSRIPAASRRGAPSSQGR